MLVLMRRPGERVYIGDATIEIVAVRGDQVRVGIAAPPEVSIVREEVATPAERARRPAAGGGGRRRCARRVG